MRAVATTISLFLSSPMRHAPVSRPSDTPESISVFIIPGRHAWASRRCPQAFAQYAVV